MTNLAIEYASALFMLACEKGKQKEYADALAQIQATFSDTPDYLTLLASPAIPLGERLATIRAAFAQNVPEDVLSYLLLLCEKGRIVHFEQSVCEYNKLLCLSERISNAKVTSALELTDEEKKKLCEKLEKKTGGKVNIEYSIDEALIGGLVVDIDGKILDGSLRGRLQRVKEVISDEHKTRRDQ